MANDGTVNEAEFRAKIASGRQIFIPSRLMGWNHGDKVIVHIKKADSDSVLESPKKKAVAPVSG